MSHIVCVTVAVAVALPPPPSVARACQTTTNAGGRATPMYLAICVPVAKLHAELNHEFILARQTEVINE